MKTQFIYFILLFVFLIPQTVQAQLISVSGYIKNQFTGVMIQNATVFESESGIGTISNAEGYYKLLLNRGKQNIKFSVAGCNPKTISIDLKADTIISIELLSEKVQGSNIAVGYKPQKDSVTSAKKQELSSDLK